ncbi:MAG: sulfotransferase [Gammaproteobacteria bacterium]|nr:sulfotransferase [Gammaproteobacteria bacterium]
MTPAQPSAQPIFVGGTGRSGTSVMGDLLGSHPAIVLPAHENKLIVEQGGLMDLVDQLGGRYDMKRHHYAVANFIGWAARLRVIGFADAALNARVRELMAAGTGLHEAFESVGRGHPGAGFSIHAVGQFIGMEHYDACVNDFVRGLIESVSAEGIVDTEGLIRPFFTPKAMTRAEALAACRAFLGRLYSLPLQRAGAQRWCDDTPDSWLYLDFLHELYPGMRFIHMIRDPRDVVGSYMKQTWAPSDPKAIVAGFKAQFAAYEAVKTRVPAECVREIRLEDISADKAAVLDDLSAFLGVENRFDGSIFAVEKAGTGSYADKLGPEVTGWIERELSDWMVRHRYLA